MVVAHKTLLRLPGAASSLAKLGPGTSFQTVVSDTLAQDRSKVERLVFVSGLHYYLLHTSQAHGALYARWILSEPR